MIQRVSLQLPTVYRAVHRATWLHVLIILGAGSALRWLLLALAPFFTTDSRCCYYHYAANQFLAGQPFDSGLHLPPGYSLFLAAILAVTDGSTSAAVLVQHLLGLAAGLLVYLIGRRLFGPLVGLAAALLTVLDVELALYEHAVMTETLFALLLLCALALVLLRLPGSIWLKVAGFGLLAGAATLVRPTGLLLPCLVLLLPGLGLASSPTRATTRHSWYRRLWHASRRVRLTLVAVVGAALILLPVMVWNQRTHGVFALTTSLQRNMLYPIRQHPERLLRERGTGDRLLGQIKATIHYHPTSPWTGPYGGLLERFHLSNEVLDRLLVRVALDFVLADPLDYVGGIVRRLPPLLTESGATAAGLVQYGRQEYAIAGGPGQLGVREYDYAADLAVAHAFDRNTRFFNLRPYAWVLLALAAFGGGRYYGRSAMLAALMLFITAISAGAIDDFSIVPRYTYPVTWVIYVLAAAGATGLFGTLRAALTTHGGGWRRLWPMQPVWPTIRRGLTARSAQSAGDLGGAERACHQLPPIVALLATAVVLVALVALAAAHRASAHRSRAAALPPVTLSGGGPPLDTQLDRLDWHLPAMYPVSRLVALSLPAQLAFDFVGPDGLIPDSQPDHPLLLTIGPEVQDLQTHAL